VTIACEEVTSMWLDSLLTAARSSGVSDRSRVCHS
jgi:hypothetical protein